jgi:hypothetical protein
MITSFDSAVQMTPMLLETQIARLFDRNFVVHDWLQVSSDWKLIQSLKKESSDSSLDWMKYLIIQLFRESNHFMNDLEATDHEFQTKGENGNDPEPLRIKDADHVNANNSSTAENNGNIPLAEIILSAHMVLLLTTLIMAYFAYAQTMTHEQSRLYEEWKQLFPRQSWWLCIRILKAYLALQGQVSILSFSIFTL